MRGCIMLLVVPPMFRAPRDLFGPGCFVCPWAAARPLAVRAASFARRVGSKPGQAPPPPTGTAARPSGPSGALHTSGAVSLTCGSARRLEARPGPAGLAAASNRSGVSVCCLARPRRPRGWAASLSSAPRLEARPCPPVPPAPFAPAAAGVLHYMKPSGGVSSACRPLV